ncbi:hypothetical protein CerSpe_064940 [Prunus speciosa]
MRWSIGNGGKVHICQDRWVPKLSTFKIYSRHPNIPDLVQGLIDPGTQTWNRDLVMLCFNGEEAQTILSLPTSRWGCEDKMIWHFSAHGGYSIRYGYDVVLDMQKNGELGRIAEGKVAVILDRRASGGCRRLQNCELSCGEAATMPLL